MDQGSLLWVLHSLLPLLDPVSTPCMAEGPLGLGEQVRFFITHQLHKPPNPVAKYDCESRRPLEGRPQEGLGQAAD